MVKDEHKSIIRHYPDGSVENVRYQHIVLNIGLKATDERFIIDLTGAQYRQYRAIMPQQEYDDKWIMCYKERESFGYWNRRWKNAVVKQNDPALEGFDVRVMIMHEQVARCINTTVDGWEKKTGKTLAKMLKQKGDIFETDKAALMKEVNRNMREYLNYCKSRPQVFRETETKVEDLPKRKDEQASKTFSFGPDVPQDVRDFMEEELRKSPSFINTSDP